MSASSGESPASQGAFAPSTRNNAGSLPWPSSMPTQPRGTPNRSPRPDRGVYAVLAAMPEPEGQQHRRVACGQMSAAGGARIGSFGWHPIARPDADTVGVSWAMRGDMVISPGGVSIGTPRLHLMLAIASAAPVDFALRAGEVQAIKRAAPARRVRPDPPRVTQRVVRPPSALDRRPK